MLYTNKTASSWLDVASFCFFCLFVCWGCFYPCAILLKGKRKEKKYNKQKPPWQVAFLQQLGWRFLPYMETRVCLTTSKDVTPHVWKAGSGTLGGVWGQARPRQAAIHKISLVDSVWSNAVSAALLRQLLVLFFFYFIQLYLPLEIQQEIGYRTLNRCGFPLSASFQSNIFEKQNKWVIAAMSDI